MGTLIGDWGNQAFFSGMPVGSIGTRFKFNDEKAQVWEENNNQLEIEEWASGIRGLTFNYTNVYLSLPNRTALLFFWISTGNSVKIEFGFYDDDPQNAKWLKPPKSEIESADEILEGAYDEKSLRGVNIVKFSGSECSIRRIMVASCPDT